MRPDWGMRRAIGLRMMTALLQEKTLLHSLPDRESPVDECAIQLNDGAPPLELPSGYVGPAWLPGTGRMIWWTGRVAIGLRCQMAPPANSSSPSSSADWLQKLMLKAA